MPFSNTDPQNGVGGDLMVVNDQNASKMRMAATATVAGGSSIHELSSIQVAASERPLVELSEAVEGTLTCSARNNPNSATASAKAELFSTIIISVVVVVAFTFMS
jgi:hypothetical protein